MPGLYIAEHIIMDPAKFGSLPSAKGETHTPGNANSNFILSNTRILSATHGPRDR
jgi:hypothetical protein